MVGSVPMVNSVPMGTCVSDTDVYGDWEGVMGATCVVTCARFGSPFDWFDWDVSVVRALDSYGDVAVVTWSSNCTGPVLDMDTEVP